METCKTGKFTKQNMFEGPEWSEELDNISRKEKSVETDDSVFLQPEKITQEN